MNIHAPAAWPDSVRQLRKEVIKIEDLLRILFGRRDAIEVALWTFVSLIIAGKDRRAYVQTTPFLLRRLCARRITSIGP